MTLNVREGFGPHASHYVPEILTWANGPMLRAIASWLCFSGIPVHTALASKGVSVIMEDGHTDLLIEKVTEKLASTLRKGMQQSKETEDGGQHGVLVTFHSEVCLKATSEEGCGVYG